MDVARPDTTEWLACPGLAADRRLRPEDTLTGVYEVRGGLDATTLQDCLAVVVGRHAALRSAFVAGAGGPLRVLLQRAFASVSLRDLRGLPAGEREAAAARTVAEAGRPFALGVAPLLRVAMARLAAERHMLAVAAHRSVADRASIGLLVRELATVYAAPAEDRAQQLPPLPAGFEDYVAWQRSCLAGPRGAAALDLWQRKLAGLPEFRLPGPPRPPSGAGVVRCRRRLPAGLAGRLGKLVDRAAAQPAVVLAGALVVLLARYSDHRDVAVGWVDPERWRPEWAPLIGPLENTLVWRVDLTGDPPFAEVVRRVAAAREEALDHRELPLEHLAGKLAPVTVRLEWETHPPTPLVAGPLTWVPLETIPGRAAADATLRVVPLADGGLTVEAEVATGLSARATVERFLAHLEAVLAAVVADPELPLSQVPLLTGQERHRLLVEWNATAAPVPSDRLLDELIEEPAGRAPEAVAVVGHGTQLSYRELDQRANQIAWWLRAAGVGPEARVGVVGERAVATIAGLLGVLKAGGAYVPLEPEWPAERVRFVLEDAGIGVVLCRDGLEDRLPAGPWRVLRLDPDWQSLKGCPTTIPEKTAVPSNLAYVIYTSGSTGRPKGVLVPHRQIVNSTAARWGCGRQPPGAYALLVSIAFDASAAAIWWTLATGGRLVLVDDTHVRDPRLAVRLIRLEQVTHLTHMPAYYQVLLAVGKKALRTLRDISVGGDVCPPRLPADHYRLLPWAQLYNDYGPSEATVWTTAYLCRPDQAGPSVPIGRPIQNARVYLLDRDLNPVPVGMVGELHIAGEGLARGYLNRPGLTAERFIPDPYAPAPGERMYRTGDLCRYLPDGNLEFVGRVDGQVKVRGFRIELGEIEASLADHPAVAETVVVARRRGQGDAELVGYVVARPGAPMPAAEELAGFLARRLPAYMIPAHFVGVDALPLTPLGKIDRGALPPPGAAGDGLAPGGPPARRSPPSAVEELVRRLSDEQVDALLAGLRAEEG
jgi:amino acid adenylation domain-containing protein